MALTLVTQFGGSKTHTLATLYHLAKAGVEVSQLHWPPVLKDSGAWPLAGLRQGFLDGSLTRLRDPDTVLRRKIVEFVESGEFGLAPGEKGGGCSFFQAALITR